MTTVHRRVVWAVACCPSLSICASRPPLPSRGIWLSTNAITATASSDTSPRILPCDPRKMAIATMGKNSPTAPPANKIRAKGPSQHVVVSQDRKQCAERRRGQRECNWDEGTYPAHCSKQPNDCASENGGGHPGPDCEHAGPVAEERKLQLITGQQKQEAQADNGQQLDASWLGQIESLWADDDATDDEYHYLRNAERHKADDKRCQCGHQRHHEQALQRDGELGRSLPCLRVVNQPPRAQAG